MFGGLELKGGVTNTNNADSGDANNASMSTTASSGFSFLNKSTSPTDANSLAPVNAVTNISAPSIGPVSSSSSFSFLHANSSSDATKNDTSTAKNVLPIMEPSSTATSAFSFLMDTPASYSSPEKLTASEEINKTESTAPPASSFSFLYNQSTGSEIVGKRTNMDPSSSSTPAPDTALESTISSTGVAVSSGFSFFNATPTPPASATTSVVDSPLHTNKAIMEIPYGTSPAGAGVTFGTSSVASAAVGIKKKRTRTAVVGAKAHQQNAAEVNTSDITNNVETSRGQQSQQTTMQETTTRESALEASKRAEAFMAEKMKQEARRESAGTSNDTDVPISHFQTLAAISSADSDDSDGIVAAARAAAEEAHKITNEGKNSKVGSSSLLSGLFRARASPPTSRHNSSRTLSGGGSGSTGAATPPPQQAPMRKSTSKLLSADDSVQVPIYNNSDTMTPSEILRIEQERVQRNLRDQHHRVETAGTLGTTGIDLTYEHKSKPIAVVTVPLPPLKNAPVLTPVVSTPMDKFNVMVSRFSEKIKCAMDEVSRLRQHRIGLLEEQHVAIAKARMASQQKAAAEAQQMAAAEAEEFELADEMSCIITKYEREAIEYEAVVDNIKHALTHLENQKKQCIDKVSACFRDIRTELLDFQKLTEADDTKDATEKLEKFSAVSKLLSAEHERLQQDWKHIERDMQQVADERKEVEAAISLQSGEYEKDFKKTNEKLGVVEEEIAELRRQLAAKQEVAAKLRTEAAGYEEAILKVRVKFARQLTRVQKKEMEIQDSQREWDAEKLNLDTQRQNHESQMSAHSEAMLERDRILAKLQTEIKLATKFESIFDSNDINFFDATTSSSKVKKEKDDDSSDLAQLQADVVKAEAAKNDSQITLKAACTALSNLEQEMKRLEASIPDLNEMKQAAANRRDFKAAGQASKEIKEATARLKCIQDELLNEAREKVTAAETEVEQKSKQLHDIAELAKEKERQLDMESMYAIAETIHKLLQMKKSWCTGTNNNAETDSKIDDDNDTAPTPSTNSDMSVQSVGAFVLDCQIKTFELQGQALGEKFSHNRWDEILKEVVGETSGKHVEEEVELQITNAEPIENDIDKERDENEENENTTSVEPTGEGSTITPQEHEQQPALGSSSLSNEERTKQFIFVTKRLKDVEDELEKAVAEEDFDQAAVLDEELAKLMNDLTELNMSDEEMELALANNSQSTSNEDSTADDVVVVDSTAGTSTQVSVEEPEVAIPESTKNNDNDVTKDSSNNDNNGETTKNNKVEDETVGENNNGDGDPITTSTNGHV